jgi:hypothetical protein
VSRHGERRETIQTAGDDAGFTSLHDARTTATQNDSDVITRTFSFGSIFCTPSATIFAPSGTPLTMTTSLLS